MFIPIGMIQACDCNPQEDNYAFISCEKTYVKPSQLGFSDGTIFVAFDNQWLETSAIYADTIGLYFKDYKSSKCGKNEWRCGYCNKCNSTSDCRCRFCRKGVCAHQ